MFTKSEMFTIIAGIGLEPIRIYLRGFLRPFCLPIPAPGQAVPVRQTLSRKTWSPRPTRERSTTHQEKKTTESE